MTAPAQKFENVSVDAKANVYFDGKVVSHSVYDKNGKKFTLGLIYPGTYKFNTGAPERMVITAGRCKVVQASGVLTAHESGQEFRIPGNSAFTITAEGGICEYVCYFE
ncbi:MAG TPA: pyrimidine/purine nucleoside phosphorylase [bacterium]|nr:pyrimidine/purine nucleoside phosphorylase [bacterium]